MRVRGRWIHFPLRPVDLLTRMPPSFVAGVVADAVRKPFKSTGGDASFASILERGLGRTICLDFYFPYAEKIWGLPAAAIDPEQARRRVSSGSLAKVLRRLLGAVPGFKKPGAGRFFYPRHGYGQISEALRRAAEGAGATIHLNANVSAVVVENGRASQVEAGVCGQRRAFPADYVLSTIPVSVLPRIVRGGDAAPIDAAARLQYRAMVLIYVTLATDRFTEFDAHYFPEAGIRLTRMSEPKNYSLTTREGRTVLCAELPCSQTDPEWTMSDEDLGALVARDLDRAGLGPVPPILGTITRRLPQAYPLYAKGYRGAFDAIDRWASAIDGLVTFGRQGLFAHDNTHHTMAMAYAVCDCVRADGTFDAARWAAARRSFEDHVVED